MSGLPKIDLVPGWDCYDWRNARTILEHGHPNEWRDIVEVLSGFSLKHSDIAKKGGRKSPISTAIDSHFYDLGWSERKFETAILVDGTRRDSPTHKVDCFKSKTALEVEWNNKDPFYDRDLEQLSTALRFAHCRRGGDRDTLFVSYGRPTARQVRARS